MFRVFAREVRDTEYRPITLANFESVPQVRALPAEMRKAIRVVGKVLPFKTNNYVVNRLIDWRNVPRDPIFALTFPVRQMLDPKHYRRIEKLLDGGAAPKKIKEEAARIRRTLNPHPAGQMHHNLPLHRGERLKGMQHKYRETVLFFPGQCQTCHAYCTFCFRWPQFFGRQDLKLATLDAQSLAEYLREHAYVTDVLFTGGDPLVMKTRLLESYIDRVLGVKSVRTIRIGTKAISYWPQRLLTDPDAGDLLALFRRVVDSGKHLAFMSHFNHWAELATPEARAAVRAVRATGAQIRTQAPVMRNINDSPQVWAKMWRMQVEQGMIPYYMFLARDTGAQRYFAVPLARACEIYRAAYTRVGGLCRSVRGPSMSAVPGKVRIVGIGEVRGEKVFVLNFIQGRNPGWVGRPFFARYDPKAVWLDDLKPAFGKREFFFEAELRGMLKAGIHWAPEPAGIPESDTVSPA
ncbi:MAG: lysine 2,3-aminomutase [Elusimicrobiota bacterium]